MFAEVNFEAGLSKGMKKCDFPFEILTNHHCRKTEFNIICLNEKEESINT